MRCLVTGATGYVGARLVPRLLARGHQVRCLVRDPGKLRDTPWAAQVEVVTGDVTTGAGLSPALRGVDLAYYLVHAMGRADFAEIDRANATHFAAAATEAALPRLVYLSGPVPRTSSSPRPPGSAPHHSGSAPHPPGSAHLRSRAQVAEILLGSRVPTVVLRAAVIIGSGSASFEMLRYLTERLPVMVAPRWVANRVQPIAIHDVLYYLLAIADPGAIPADVNRAFDIGGPEVLSYAGMMRRYARVAELPARMIVPVRPLTPSLSAYWVGAVTPVPNAIARPLVASLIHEAICHDHDIAEYLPDPAPRLVDFDTSVRLALRRVRGVEVTIRRSSTWWPESAGALAAAPVPAEPLPSDPLPSEPLPSDPLPSDPGWSGGSVYTDRRGHPVDAPVCALWRAIETIGRAGGGPGRCRPVLVRALGRWRVEKTVPRELLRLRAVPRMPGQAWLELGARPDGDDHCRYRQRAIFVPHGLAGHAFWAAVRPIRAMFLGGLAAWVTHRAEHPGGAASRSDRLSAAGEHHRQRVDRRLDLVGDSGELPL